MASYHEPKASPRLAALTLCIWIAGTLAEANSSSVGQAQTPAWTSVQQSFLSLFNLVLTWTRQRYLRITNGQIGVWDMVQLITACSLVQTIRIWRRQKAAQRPESGSAKGPANDDRSRRDSATALSRVDSESSTTGKLDGFTDAARRLNPIIWH